MSLLSPRAGVSKVGMVKDVGSREGCQMWAGLDSQPPAPSTCRSHKPLAHQEATSEDPQGAA
jgi:hypothetical protein